MIFTNVVKPTHLCNLSCTYCYNDDVRDPVMRPETLHRTISQTFRYVRESASDRSISFIWHGGEPTLPGVKFYRQVADLQAEHAGALPYNNSLQTNGTLLDDEWLEFLTSHRYSVSISIDGPPQLHDRFRIDRRGRGTFARVQAAIGRVQDAGIPLGVCVVVSRANVDQLDAIYDFLAEQRLRFTIIPLNRSGAARENYDDVGLAPEEYAPAWIRMFDRWFDADRDYVYCSDFVFKTRAILAGRPADCVALQQCADTNISVDPVGDVYPCASLSGIAATRYGNLLTHDLAGIMDSPAARAYRNRRTDPQCARCRWQHVCHGGCQARAYKFYGDHHQRDYYCPSLFRIYEHVAKRLADKLGGPGLPPQQPPEDPRAALMRPAPTTIPITLLRRRDGQAVQLGQ